jgi:hypothetical protein
MVVELCGLIMLNSLPVAHFAVVAHFACGALDYRVIECQARAPLRMKGCRSHDLP